jgi:hypothetical protein
MRRDMENLKLKAQNERLMKENRALKKQDKQPEAKVETPKTRAETLFQGQNSPKKLKKVYTLEQWVEVRIEDGKTVTTLYPSNAQLIEDGKKMYPPPDYVYRRINFPNGIPEEYYWVNQDPVARKLGGCGIQRMTPDTWLDVIEREEAGGTGHVGPTGVGNLPKPKDRGGCDCPVCTHNAVILEQVGS